MSSDDGDDDLELLRSAALASLRRKPLVYHHTENEDIDSLRSRALTSKNISEPFQKDSSLSNQRLERTRDKLCSPSDQSDCESESKKNESNRSSSSCDDETSDSSDSSDDDKETSEKEDDHQPMHKEEDLLTAIDQFLDEGVMLLEEAITPIKPVPQKKKTKRKKMKKEKLKKNKKEILNIIQKQAAEDIDKSATEKKAAVLNEVKSPANQIADIKDNSPRRQPIVWESSDLPLDRNSSQKREGDERSASVHSSDLSFLSDQESSAKDTKHEVKRSESRGKFIIVNKNKLEQLRRSRRREPDSTTSYDDRFQQVNELSERQHTNTTGRHEQAKMPFRDLRDKLRQKGLHRSVSSEPVVSSDANSHNRTSENGRSTIQVNRGNKIFIKPSLVYGNHGADQIVLNTMAASSEEVFSKFSITREPEEHFRDAANVSFVADENSNEIDQSSERKKRSVVQFKPNSSLHEKRKKLEIIQHEVESQTKDADDFSDLSEDFDTFELDEPDENTIHNTVRILSTNDDDGPGKSPSPDARRYVSTAGAGRKSGTRRLDDADDDVREPKKTRNVIRGTPAEPVRSGRHRFSAISKLKSTLGTRDDDDAEHRRRRDVSARDRTVAALSSRLNWSSSRDDSRSKSRSLPARKDAVHVRNRGADDAAGSLNSADEPAAKSSTSRSVKQRLGFSKGNSPPKERRTRASDRSLNEKKAKDAAALKAQREKDVDDRIRRIQEKNNQILKRRQLIEMEEKTHRVKVP